MSEKKPVYLVQINYKSGIQVECEFLEFSLLAAPGGGVEVTWRGTDDQNPLWLNASAMESVYQKGVRYV